MINNSEDKLINFTLYRAHENWRVDKTYTLNELVWHDGKYYEYIFATPTSGIALTNATYWTLLAERKRFDTTNISGIVIVLYFKGSRNIIKKYSLNALAGYSAIDDTDKANSIYSIIILSAETVNLKEGILLAEIKIKETTVGVGSGFMNTIISDIPIAEINAPITEYIAVT